MNNDFHTLMEFLGRLEPEVTGKTTPVPDPSHVPRLERFALGQTQKAERTDTCELLRMHPAWLRWLADRVRMAREVAPELAPK